jgi:drug/metabolite transporter (DMT)-like permease
MDEPLKFRPFGISALILMAVGWGGLYYLITQTLPYVWPRWGFFVLALMALTGTILPIVYFFHKRFPDEVPADTPVIVRQSMWFGVYGATLAWLQLGRLVTVYVILSLAGGLIAIEYFIRLRERSHWTPPAKEEDE